METRKMLTNPPTPFGRKLVPKAIHEVSEFMAPQEIISFLSMKGEQGMNPELPP